MSDIIISIKGLPELLTKVSNLPEEIQREVEGEIIDSVMRINGQQRKKAPKDQGGLVRNIGFERQQSQWKSVFTLYANAENSGYMEFGTKNKAVIPANLQAIALEMKGAGIKSRLKAKEAIYAWCKRKGIDKKAWWPIYASIMANGIAPHPFFFQPFFDEEPKLLQRIEDIINQNEKL